MVCTILTAVSTNEDGWSSTARWPSQTVRGIGGVIQTLLTWQIQKDHVSKLQANHFISLFIHEMTRLTRRLQTLERGCHKNQYHQLVTKWLVYYLSINSINRKILYNIQGCTFLFVSNFDKCIYHLYQQLQTKLSEACDHQTSAQI